MKKFISIFICIIIITSLGARVGNKIHANELPKFDVGFDSAKKYEVINTNSSNDASFVFNIIRSQNLTKHVYTRLMVKIYLNDGKNTPVESFVRTREFDELYSVGDGETPGLDPDEDGLVNEIDNCPKEPGYYTYGGCAAGYGYMNDHAKDLPNCDQNKRDETICRSDDYFLCEIQNGDDYCPYGKKDFIGMDLKINDRLKGMSLKIVVKLVANGYVDSNSGNDRLVVVYRVE